MSVVSKDLSEQAVSANAVGTRLSDTCAVLAGMALSAFGWWLGAFFTIICLHELGWVTSHSWWLWLIPAGVSAIELRFWPRPATLWSYRSLVFLLVALVDIGSTSYGLAAWLSGRTVPLFSGYVLPQEGGLLLGATILAALLVTFVSERTLVRGLRDLALIWNITTVPFLGWLIQVKG